MSMTPERVTGSAAETRELGGRVAEHLEPGDVLFLVGDLGAGKTTFVQGMAVALRVVATVRSPTYALMHRYRGDPDLIHIDLYRESDASALEDLNWEEEGKVAVTVVEWPRGLGEVLWPNARTVWIEHAGGDERRILVPAGLFGD